MGTPVPVTRREEPIVVLVSPPTTLANTPYSATPHLTGYLRSRDIRVVQVDVGLELLLRVFSKRGLERVRESIAADGADKSADTAVRAFLQNYDRYLEVIAPTLCFLQRKDPTLALRIASRNYFPPGALDHCSNAGCSVDDLGMETWARMRASGFIATVAQVVTTAVDRKFTLQGYGSELVANARSFAEIEEALLAPGSLIGSFIAEIVDDLVLRLQPDIVGLTAPFPGTLYGAFEVAARVRQRSPHVRLALGGAYVSTELRALNDPSVFDYFDYVVLDEGYLPLVAIVEEVRDKFAQEPRKLFRTFVREGDAVKFLSVGEDSHLAHADTGTPTYDGLQLDSYFSCVTSPSVGDRLWSEWSWNELVVSHGCYWRKCAFCDVELDYVKRFDRASPAETVARIEALADETGRSGFHFVDEALPPSVLGELARELLKRHISISWWGNIRFDKAFSPALAELLACSGCVAVTAGLEAPSDRLLQIVQKGITVAQAARVAKAFRSAGVLVHAYLMYGLPTETAQETIDGLEIVRQFFAQGLLNGAHWHRFALTAFSPMGQAPETFGIRMLRATEPRFVGLELRMDDGAGLDHSMFGAGLQRAVSQYKVGKGLERDVREWFDREVPQPTIPCEYVGSLLTG